jgi:hypothetical protein
MPHAYAVAIVLLTSAVGGCGPDAQCVPPLSDERTDVGAARLPDAWTSGEVTSFQIVVTTGPYRVSDHAIEQLRAVMSDQAGLQVEITEGADTHLAESGVLDHEDVITAGRDQIPPGDQPVVVIVVVDDTTHPDATYGFIRIHNTSRSTAVMALHRGPILDYAIGPISMETIESTVTVHEVGHWLGVPARDFHTSALDRIHCTCARCVMYKGIKYAPVCVVLANLFTGIPVRFCSDCAEELAESQRRRQADR